MLILPLLGYHLLLLPLNVFWNTLPVTSPNNHILKLAIHSLKTKMKLSVQSHVAYKFLGPYLWAAHYFSLKEIVLIRAWSVFSHNNLKGTLSQLSAGVNTIYLFFSQKNNRTVSLTWQDFLEDRSLLTEKCCLHSQIRFLTFEKVFNLI